MISTTEIFGTFILSGGQFIKLLKKNCQISVKIRNKTFKKETADRITGKPRMVCFQIGSNNCTIMIQDSKFSFHSL